MRKVLMLSIGYGELGGVGTVTKELAEALNARADYEVDVLCYWPWRKSEGKFPWYSVNSEGTYGYYDALDQFLTKISADYDAVHFHNHVFSDPYLRMDESNTTTLDDFLAKIKAPSIMTTHSVALTQCKHEPATWNNMQLEAQRQIMSRVDRIVHLTADQKEYCDSIMPEYAGKTVVIGNGVRDATLDDVVDVEREHPVGLYLGRISNEKGIWELLEATSEIKQAHPDYKLRIAGNREGQPTQELEEKIASHGLSIGEDVELLGWITDEHEKEKIIRQSDFVILPSYYEHFPMAALETMVTETPFIISNVPGPRSVFSLDNADRRAALPIPEVGDAGSIARSICYAIEHPEEMRTISRRAKSLVERNFKWNHIAEQYHALFSELTQPVDRQTAVHPRDHSQSLVGCVIPSYNRKEDVTETIDSLLAQDYSDIKIVVVDDGSIDDTFEHLTEKYRNDIDYVEDYIVGSHTELRGKDGKIIIVRQANKHVAAARNTGLRILHGLGCEYFTHQDAGDVALPHKVRTLVDHLEAHPEFSIVHARALERDENHHLQENGVYERFFAPRWARAHEDPVKYSDDLARAREYIHNQTTLWRRSVMDALGLHNLQWEGVKYGEDWDFYIKIAREHFTYGFVDEPVAIATHHCDPLALTGSGDPIQNAIEVLEKKVHKEPKDALGAVRFLRIGQKVREERDKRPDEGNPQHQIPLTNHDLFELEFESLFTLSFERDFETKMGNLSRALLLAEELVKFAPTEHNKAQLAAIRRRLHLL